MATYSNFKNTIIKEIGTASGEPVLDSAAVSGIISSTDLLDSADVINLIDSDYVSARAGAGGGGASVGTSVAMSLIFS